MIVIWDTLQNTVSARLNEVTTRGLNLVRSKAAYVRMFAVEGCTLADIESPALVIKRSDKYDSNGVALVTGFTKNEGGWWEGVIDLITVPIDADLGVDGDDSDDVRAVRYMAGLGRMVNGVWVSSPRFDVKVENNVSRGTEETPSQPPSGGVHIYSALTGGIDSVDSIPTDGMNLPLTALAVVGGVFSVWSLNDGTQASDPSGGVIRPLDYSPTNERIWLQAA